MKSLIKIQSSGRVIIKKILFNFSSKYKLPGSEFLLNKIRNLNKPSQKQNLKIFAKAKNNIYYFSTLLQPPQMQPQIKKAYQNKPQQMPQKQSQLNDALTEGNTIAEYDQALFGQVVNYEKPKADSEEYARLRSTKRRQKLEKIRAELRDPENRKQRNRERHRRQKEKLDKALQGLTEEEIKSFLTQRKAQKALLKEKVKEQVEKEIGQPFLIDIAFEHRMNQKQNKSLAIQIELIVKALKHIQPAPNVHLCGLKEGLVKSQLQKNRYEVWPIKSYQEPLEECLKLEKFKNKKIYYLSPDSPKTLDTIEPGGLVDRTVIKNASLNRAQSLKIEAKSLPIRPFMKQRSCLNLDHIVTIMCKYMEVKDWKVAFEHGAPKRWKCAEGEKGLKELKQSDHSDHND